MLKSVKTILLTNVPTNANDPHQENQNNSIAAYSINGFIKREERKKKRKELEEDETSSLSSNASGEMTTLTYHLMYIPRILKNDLRRQYPIMFANVYNSCDYDFMTKFLNQFCDNSASVTITDSYAKDGELSCFPPKSYFFKRYLSDATRTLSAEGHGLEHCRTLWAFRMNDAPDVCMQLQSVQMRIRSDGTCTCEAKHTYKGTAIIYVNPKKIPKILNSCKVNENGILVLPNLPSPGIFIKQATHPKVEEQQTRSGEDELLVTELNELFEIDQQLLREFVHSLQGEDTSEHNSTDTFLEEESEYLFSVFTDLMHPERLTPRTPDLEETLPLGFPFEYYGDLIFRLNEESKIFHVDFSTSLVTKE